MMYLKAQFENFIICPPARHGIREFESNRDRMRIEKNDSPGGSEKIKFEKKIR